MGVEYILVGKATFTALHPFCWVLVTVITDSTRIDGTDGGSHDGGG